jgi:alpha-beta hydrolase superfamily lysophospholipase
MRPVEEKTFSTHDGVDLFYRYWPSVEKQGKSKQATAQGAIVLMHRGHEHSGRMAHLVNELRLPNYAFFAYDARGYGLSPGVRGFSPSLAASVRDVQTFVDHLTKHYQIPAENIAVIAQSVGAVVTSTWAHDYAPKIRCIVLASPAFKVKLYVPFARFFLKLRYRVSGNFFVNSYVKANYLTHDPERIASYNSDPLITRPISANILLALYATAERIVADAEAIQVPTQMLISDDDWVVHHLPQYQFFARLGTKIKEIHLLAGFFHDTFGEKDRVLAVDSAHDFIVRQFAKNPTRDNLRNAHLAGFTKREADTLAEPLPPNSVRGWYWRITRFWLTVFGLVSAGIKLGHQTGFDSGSTLDYIYRNQPAGLTPLGRLIDWTYLNSVGWRGIRQRKLNVEELLRKAMTLLADAKSKIHIVDIAAGHGRYVLEALADSKIKPDSILLRDYSGINVRDGSALIQAKGLQKIARFERGDAFDADSLAAIKTRPTIGIVSGLYELFADNDQVNRSLAGLSAAIPTGGYLIYTGQPWHPQLEFIARALTSHRQGSAWVMRRRTQAEMDQLVEAAGFRKLEQRIDEWGIFTVSLAQRNG